MKYESNKIIIAGTFFLFILLSVFISISNRKYFRKYQIINATVVKSNLITFIVENKTIKLFYENKYIYIADKKEKFNIENITKNIIKRKATNYSQLLVRCNVSLKKENDIVEFVIEEKKINLWDIVINIWKGDRDEES